AHSPLLLYVGHAPLAIKAHGSRGVVGPNLEAAAVAGLLLNNACWLAPYGPHFVTRHADARLCGRGGGFLLGRRILGGFFSWFFLVLKIHWHPPPRLKLAGEDFLESLAPFFPALLYLAPRPP